MSRRPLPAPRWQTPLPPGVDGSWGPDVELVARELLGIRFDRWQRRAINRALATRGGRLVHRHYLVSAGRQNGKTGGVRALIEWALTARRSPAWSLIMGLAHDRAQARVPYTAVLADLVPLKHRWPAELALTRYLGIRSDLFGRHREYHTASREARDALRTFSVDLAVFDEVRTQRNFDTWSALEPTTRARPEALIFAISSAGDDRSILLRDWFDRGRRIIDGAEPAEGFGMTWYAAADELAPDDPEAIRQANPAVAEGRIPIGPVAASIRTLPASQYRAETLNLFSEGVDEWLPPGTWPARVAPQPEVGMRIVLGVEAVPSWRRASVTVAIVTDAGAWVGIAGELDAARSSSSTIAPGDLATLLAQLIGTWHPAAVAFSGAAAAAPYAKATAEAARVEAIALGPRQIRAASSLFRSELVGARLTHADDPLLGQQVRLARPSGPLEGGDWYFSIRESLGEIDALRAAAWSAWAAIAPPEREVGSQLFL